MICDDTPKRRSAATGVLVGTRFQPPLLDALDAWRKEQDDSPTRPEAVRRLIGLAMRFPTSNMPSEQRLTTPVVEKTFKA
jgi:hypothetical protein